jgi:hypothetical protein
MVSIGFIGLFRKTTLHEKLITGLAIYFETTCTRQTHPSAKDIILGIS